jgi:hypothetical protein
VSARSTRWLLFAAFAIALPFPSPPPFGGFVPAVHNLALFAATGAVAAAEGVAGPVRPMLTMFAVQTVVTLLGCALLAWLLSWILARLPARARTIAAVGLCAALLGTAIAVPIYDTPFGRQPTANLFGVLG